MKKIFNIKTYAIFVIVCMVGIIVSGEIVDRQRYNKLEKKKEMSEDNPLMSYVSGDVYSFNDVMGECGWEQEEFTGVTFSVDHTGEGRCGYYFEDEELMEEIMNKLDDINIYEQSGAMPSSYSDIVRWQCSLIHKDSKKKCALLITSNRTIVDNAQTIRFETTSSDYNGKVLQDCPLNDFMPNGALMFDENMVEFWLDVFERYVIKMDIDKLIEWNNRGSEDVTLKDYFKYEHSPQISKIFHDEDGEKSGHKYDFEIDGTGCYLQLEKYYCTYNTESGHVTYNDIVSVKIFNKDGESIDLYDVDESELREFVK